MKTIFKLINKTQYTLCGKKNTKKFLYSKINHKKIFNVMTNINY